MPFVQLFARKLQFNTLLQGWQRVRRRPAGFGRLSPPATPARLPGGAPRRAGIPGAPPQEAQAGPARRVRPTPPAARGASGSPVGTGAAALGGDRQAAPAGTGARGPRAHTCARAALQPRRTPAPGPSAAAAPDGGRGRGRRRHPPGSTSSVGGSSRAGSPWHHLPPPPRPRRRLPTAHPALPTDTIAGVPVPAAAPNSGREGGVRAEEGRGQAPRLCVGGRGEGGRGPSEPRGRGDGRSLRQRRGVGRAADTAAAGFVIVDSVPSSAEHAGSRRAGEGRPAAQRGGAQVRKSAACRERGGARGRRCPLLTWGHRAARPGYCGRGRARTPSSCNFITPPQQDTAEKRK
ncbi:collagen alpha-1(I) chain-like [Myotis myotis]|uniref:collagen alpha-1(I) chain-like n=1 Tax=Myotis myotis TaxID=51298 RepID=UPI00174D5721|nr:collagen alpha-1(I) chain-like [Myotis myotis]